MKRISHSKPYVDESDVKAVAEVVRSQKHANLSKVKEFEDAMTKLIGHRYAKACSSGTTALQLSLLALGIKEGDEVIIPSYVCGDVLNAVNHVKAKAVLTDIDTDVNKCYNISAKTIEPKITIKTKAIILPYLFGIPSDISPVIDLGIPIIEDCAQCLGVRYNGKITGSNTIISIFSFYATKTISTGQGGMILTSNDKIKSILDDLMTYDKKPVYTVGYNYNMTDIQAALGLSQLNKLDKLISRRKEIAKKYDEAFKGLDIQLTNYLDGSYPYRYIIRLKDKETRDKLNSHLNNLEIHSGDRPVFYPLHRYIKLNNEDYINSDIAYDTVLSIPIYPALTDVEVERIIDSVRDFFSS